MPNDLALTNEMARDLALCWWNTPNPVTRLGAALTLNRMLGERGITAEHHPEQFTDLMWLWVRFGDGATYHVPLNGEITYAQVGEEVVVRISEEIQISRPAVSGGRE